MGLVLSRRSRRVIEPSGELDLRLWRCVSWQDGYIKEAVGSSLTETAAKGLQHA